MSGIISDNVGRASGLLKAGAAGGLVGYAFSNNGFTFCNNYQFMKFCINL